MVITVGREPDPAKRIRQRWGNHLRQVRTMRGMTVAELAERINALDARGVHVTAGGVSHWENGVASPRPVMQIAVAIALDVPWSTIFSLDGESLT